MITFKSFIQNYVLFFDYNKSGDKVPCACCGKKNNRYDRMDTESVFNEPVSYCIICWWEAIWKDMGKK